MKTLTKLYPTLSPAELQEAEHNFRRYLEIAIAVAQEQVEANANQAMEDHGQDT